MTTNFKFLKSFPKVCLSNFLSSQSPPDRVPLLMPYAFVHSSHNLLVLYPHPYCKTPLNYVELSHVTIRCTILDKAVCWKAGLFTIEFIRLMTN